MPVDLEKLITKHIKDRNDPHRTTPIEVFGVEVTGTDIADAISKKHSNNLDHSNSLDHDAIHNHSGVYESANTNIQAHIISTHAPSNAQKNSDITKAEIETKLTGEIASHSHAGGGGGISMLKKTADQTINGTAFQNITDLVFNVVVNTDYAFKFYIVFRSAATTTGFRFGVLAPTGAVLDFFMTYQTIANATTVGVATWLQGHWVSGEAMAALTATIAAGVDLVCMIEGRVKVGATAGTLAARVASELANNDLVVQKGSWGTYF